MREIRIRQLRYDDAREKLEREIQEAYVAGETHIEILHGIGEGILKKMAIDYVKSQDYLKLLERPSMLRQNPGTTQVEILAPSPEVIRKYMKS
jgi:DNA-nicking Smr family endonuclease